MEIEIPLEPNLELSFDLAAIFDTPVQTNIDNCGVPVWPEPPTTYVPIVGVNAQASSTIRYEAAEYPSGVWSSVSNTTHVPGIDSGFLTLEMTCRQGERLYLEVRSFPAFEESRPVVTIIIDGNEAETSQWSIGLLR